MLCNTTDGDKGDCNGRRQFPDGDGIIHWPVAGVLQTNARSGRGCRRGKAGILNPADNTYDSRTEIQDRRATGVARLVLLCKSLQSQLTGSTAPVLRLRSI